MGLICPSACLLFYFEFCLDLHSVGGNSKEKYSGFDLYSCWVSIWLFTSNTGGEVRTPYGHIGLSMLPLAPVPYVNSSSCPSCNFNKKTNKVSEIC